ncbi:MAG: BatA domain-containing protein [Cytophagales bacterium]
MSFAAPFFLYALAAIAIPIIIHLFDLQRPKKVFFTNVRLLRNINEQTSSTRKLKNFWLLLCRILAIVFLVLAFCQPFINGKNNDMALGSQSVGVYVDNSMSMQNSDGQKPLLQSARKKAEQLTQILSAATKYYYLDNQFLPKDKRELSAESFNDRLTETNLAATSRTLENIYQKQKNILDNIPSQAKKLFWFSDFQKSTVGNLASLKVDSTINLYLVPFQNQAVSNIYIDSVWLENVFVKTYETNTLKVKVKNSGTKNSSNLHLKLILDDVQSGMSSVEISANSETIVSFNFTVKDKNIKKGKISFEDSPIDFDNTYFFTINVASSIKIALLTDNSKSFVGKVYSNESVFDISSYDLANVPLIALQNAQLIVIEDFDKLNGSTIPLLKSQLEKGKSIFLIPSEKPSPSSLTQFSNELNLPLIESNTLITSDITSVDDLKMPELKNPFFANIFESVDKNMAVPYAKPAIKWGNKGQTLLQTKKDEAFIAVFNKKIGRIFICSSPLAEKFTSFQRHSIFVPFMYKLATQSAATNKNLDFSFNDKNVSVFVDKPDNKKKMSIKKDVFSYIPEQNRQGNQLIFNIPQENTAPGFYDLVLNDSVFSSIAINIPKAESKLANYSAKELKSIFEGKKNITIYENADNEAFANDFKAAYVGTPLWKYCIMLALFFLFVEIILIRFLK